MVVASLDYLSGLTAGGKNRWWWPRRRGIGATEDAPHDEHLSLGLFVVCWAVHGQQGDP